MVQTVQGCGSMVANISTIKSCSEKMIARWTVSRDFYPIVKRLQPEDLDRYEYKILQDYTELLDYTLALSLYVQSKKYSDSDKLVIDKILDDLDSALDKTPEAPPEYESWYEYMIVKHTL